MATPGVIKVSTGLFMLIGVLWCSVVVVFSPSFDGDVLPAAGLAVLTTAGGLLMLRYGHLLARRAHHLTTFATLVVSVCFLALAQDNGTVYTSMSAPMLLLLVNTAFLFSIREALPWLLVITATATVSLVRFGAEVPNLVLMQGCGLTVALMTAWLARMGDIAEEDALTRLLNRRGFDRLLEETVARVDSVGGSLSLALFDIDHFKTVNDTEGHHAGDQLLVDCARAWSAAIPPSSSLTRYGGDEFALLMPGLPAGAAADLVDLLCKLTPKGITVSAGVAGWRAGDGESDLFRNADLALYDAKMTGRDQTVSYDDPDRAGARLERAVLENEMFLEFQPLARLTHGSVTVGGFEALVRWQHPERGRIMPDGFIPIAERTGAINQVGSWVLREVFRLGAAMRDGRVAFNVNVSAVQLRDAGFVELVREGLAMWGQDPSLLILELTESVFDDGPHVEQTLRELREMGIRVAIDDFGAGYSSLRRLGKLPIDIIKLDGALIEGIEEGSFEAPILEAIAAMGLGLGVELVAEHVETHHQFEVVRRLGFDFVQGYLMGKPMCWEEALLHLDMGAPTEIRRSSLSARLTARALLRQSEEPSSAQR